MSGRSTTRLLLAVLITALPLAGLPSRAAPARARILRGLETHSVAGATELHVQFGVPIRYVSHTPEGSGTSIDVRVTPVTRGPADTLASHARESLQAPPGVDVPLVDVTYNGDRGAGASVEVRFSRPVTFEVRQGRDLRSLIVTLPKPSSAPAPTPGPAASGDAALIAKLMAAGRSALEAGDASRAVQLFTLVLGFPENEHSPDARELLGAARERKGQLAQARAEYEEYLERYPDGEGAERVRRRLETLLAFEDPAAPRRGEERGRSWILDHEVYGSISTHYRRDIRRTDLTGRIPADESLYSDLFVSARLATERFDLVGEVTGSYLADFRDGDHDRSRLNSLFVDVVDRGSPLFGTIGRQPGNTAGVSSRFDGVRLGYQLNETFSVTARAGFPMDPYISDDIETDTYFYGLSLDARDIFEGLDAQLFVLHQRADGFTDRTAVGGEFRYVRGRLFLAGMIDYDLHFSDVNIAFLTANWRATDATSLNLFVDYRYAPLLTTSNALLGQLDDDLSDLRDRPHRRDIDTLAEDRTARSKLITLDVTHQLSERFQLVADFTVSDLSGTSTSGGVGGFEGTGHYYTYLVQVIGTRLIQEGDVTRVALRYDDSRALNRASLLIASRIPAGRRLRFNPALTLEYGDTTHADHYYVIRPGLRLDYRVGPITLDAEASYEWIEGDRFEGSGDESGYTLLVGARYDF